MIHSDVRAPSFSYRERFTIGLGIAVIIFSAVGIFIGASNLIFICVVTMILVSVIVIQHVQALRSNSVTLRESEERFRLLVSEVQEYAIFAVSLNGKVVSWNLGAERIAGYCSGEIVDHPFAELLAGETLDGGADSILNSVRETGRYQDEVWFKAKNGRRFLATTVITLLMNSRQQPRDYSVVVCDVTAKRKSEQDLITSYRFIERITRTIPYILFIFDRVALQKIYVNEGAGPMLGYTPEQMATMGANFFVEVLHPDDLKKFLTLCENAAAIQDGQIVEMECRMNHAASGWRHLACRIVVFARDDEGRPNQFLGIGQDVTALKKVQEESRRLELAALSRQRLALLGELSAGVAHEIRNPLQGILNCVEELRNQCSGNTNLTSTVELLEEGLQRMDHISSRLLRLARNHDGEKVPSDVAQCIEGTCAFVRTRAVKSGIALQTEIEPGLPLVPMNADRISEALLNLINNALDSCSSGGRVALVACRSKVPGMLELRVSDSGSGIPADARERIFDAFFTTKPPGKGTGLGMTIVKKNVEAHEGTVELAETSAKGTTFRVLIPLN